MSESEALPVGEFAEPDAANEVVIPGDPRVPPRFTLPPVWLLVSWLLILISVWPTLLGFSQRGSAPSPDEINLIARLYQARRYREAAEASRKVLRAHPDSVDALIDLGMSSAQLRKWDEAIPALQHALVVRPDNQLAWNDLRWTLAMKAAEKPTAESWQEKGQDAYSQGDFNGCIALTQQALRLWPQYPKALNVLSLCYLNLGRFDESIAAAREALRIEPTFQLAKNNLAMALERKAKGFTPPPPPSAAPVPAPAGDANALVNSSVQNYRAGHMQACIDDARAALKLNPNLAVAYNNIAACSNDLGKPEDAIVAANQALKLQPDFELARNNLAVAVNLKINRDKARR